MRNEKGICFKQSTADFPLTVDLNRKIPEWGLYRWNGNIGLRFFPADDERFTLRGDKRRLLYKGRRCSHRFTILGDTAFEYDCFLKKEPESNVISLRMEGAENFDFFRQPDFIREPLLAGSYAVYKKETIIGEGTGKLCHIQKPEIIDASGRRCWGDLTVIGNELRITIPEWWLSEAKYPVVVDPTVGTATVGSQSIFYDDFNEDWYELFIELGVGVNRYLLSETFNGNGTAYLYAYNKEFDNVCKPVLYSDKNNSPLTRRSANEGFYDISVNNSKPAGWRSTNFQTNTSIAGGNYIWFGIICNYFAPRFDYGAKLFWCFLDDLIDKVPDAFPKYADSDHYNFKLSMYFTYSTGQNYLRTITQGVNITDSKILSADYKCITAQTVRANTVINNLKILYRKIREAIICVENIFLPVLFIRKVYDAVKVYDTLKHFRTIYIGLYEIVNIEGKAKSGRVYYSKISDTVFTAGVMFRALFLFVRIITKVFISDYLLERFLIAKTELKIKSCIVRELFLESRIN